MKCHLTNVCAYIVTGIFLKAVLIGESGRKEIQIETVVMHLNHCLAAINSATKTVVSESPFPRYWFGRQSGNQRERTVYARNCLGLFTTTKFVSKRYCSSTSLHSDSISAVGQTCSPVLGRTCVRNVWCTLLSTRGAWCPKADSMFCQRRYFYIQQGKTYVPWRLHNSVPDLQRFLSEIGTDPKEARFWLKQFLNVNQKIPFAVIEIDPTVFEVQVQLEHTASCVSFLQRNCLRPVLVYGDTSIQNKTHQELQSSLLAKGKALSDALRHQSLESCLLFAGSGVIETDLPSMSEEPEMLIVNEDLIQWNMERHVVPIIPAYGVTAHGQVRHIGLWDVTCAISRQLQPLKVMTINCCGGFQDEKGQVIANINLPFDFEAAKNKSWCTDSVLKTIQQVSLLLSLLPDRTSLVITSPDKMLQELFTHHGSGTFLKINEPILKYSSFDDIDSERLGSLLAMSFAKPLSKTYFQDVSNLVHTIFLSECYMAAAIILNFPDCDVPYLCKFAVSAQARGEGTSEIIWERMQQEFKQLFWRSRGNNPINPWYFKKCEGSWSNGNWTVFWYGVPEPQLSMDLINKALLVPESFITVHESDSQQTQTVK